MVLAVAEETEAAQWDRRFVPRAIPPSAVLSGIEE